jgi:ankyrin repeat protein
MFVVDGKVEQARFMIRDGADACQNGELLCIAIKQRNAEMVNLLLEHGANPNVYASNGKSPLELAVSENNLEFTNLFIAKDANVVKHSRALELAIQNENLIVVKRLLECDAPIRKPKKLKALLDKQDQGNENILFCLNKLCQQEVMRIYEQEMLLAQDVARRYEYVTTGQALSLDEYQDVSNRRDQLSRRYGLFARQTTYQEASQINDEKEAPRHTL